jgi:pyruvate kinase
MRRARLAKIVATIGPASASPAMLRRLSDVGVDCFRVNFSHGTHDQHGEVIARLRAVEAASGRPIAILADLQGPKIRLGDIEGGELAVRYGDRLVLEASHAATAGDVVRLPQRAGKGAAATAATVTTRTTDIPRVSRRLMYFSPPSL